MIRCAALLVALAGCDALFDLDHLKSPNDAGTGSDAADAKVDGPGEGVICVGKYMSICPAVIVPTLAITGPAIIDTDIDTRCEVVPPSNDYPGVCIIAAETISIDAPVVVKGSRVLVLAAVEALSITQNGFIDVSSTREGAGRVGPAANAGAILGCTPSPGDPQTGLGGAGGGAGGSFGGTGGSGGLGDNGTRANSNFALTSPPTRLRGGCAGAAGGASANTNSASKGGDSGGALYLTAGGVISVVGRVMANGNGGTGGGFNNDNEHAGGAGGGSGGLVVFDAPAISLAGIVVAQGGGGGGGADGTAQGNTGAEWKVNAPDLGATGGGGGNNGGTGGEGSSAASTSGYGGGDFDANNGGAAGGGGGGAGYILTYGTVSQASQTYPAPIALQ